MKEASRVLVAMDLSKMDEHLMRALHYYHPFLNVQKAYFLHVIPDFNAPKEGKVEFMKLFAPEYPIDEKVTDKLNLDLVDVFGENPPFETQVDVREGKPIDKLIHWLEVKEIDWAIVGHKQKSEGSGITARRVARHSNCNIIFVPDAPLKYIEDILIPVDFSETSAKAIRQACNWKRRREEIKLHLLYIIDLPPTDYYLSPAPTSGFQAVLRESAEKAFNQFVEKYGLQDVSMNVIYQENTYSNIASHVHEYTQKNEIDMVLMGAKGHSNLSSFLFGSVTESLVERQLDVPVMIVR